MQKREKKEYTGPVWNSAPCETEFFGDMRYDYTGGFDPVLVELSDALDASAYEDHM